MSKPAVIPRHTDSNGWWNSLAPPPVPRSLTGRVRVRTAVVGGGICGVSATNRLAELCPDEEICLIEAERVGYGASGRNAGFMLNLHSHGAPKQLEILRRNMQLWEAGLNSLRRKVESWQIQCDWSEAGRFYGAAGPDGEKHLGHIAETLDALDLPYTWQGRDALEQRIGTGFYSNGLHTGGNALVNPAALMRGLAQHLPANVTLFEESPVTELEPLDNGYKIWTPDGEVIADRVVLATGVFLRQFGIATAHFVPMATYGSLTAPLDPAALSVLGTGEEFGMLGGSEYGATIRLTWDKRLFVRNYFNFVPGAPASRGRVAEISQMHRRAMAVRWPDLSDQPFEHSWGGSMAFTRNNGTVFGSFGPNLYAVLTNDVSPMTRGEAAGSLLAEYMENIDSELLSLQLSIPGPSRLPPRPFLDLGIRLRHGYLHLIARDEF
ncbi:FAD-binding oxidoreductase [Pelagibius sp. Alg239-R121]|uniref:NAD(P)/FAD-dependent oxidoreductase n=1 Tax=Pelagibius sp. Alg239-R121 TaxID=2993448 RepID=UPI0024A610D1|nr:FAD-binding oxidoreductase [Pelagibius sp. Alg239-R121]